MVDTFGFRPGGPYGMRAPFGFGPPGLQGPAASAGGNGQGGDVADVIPVGAPGLFCQNVNCGARTAGSSYPLCQDCNRRLELGDGPYLLENGKIIRTPVPPSK